MSDMSEPKMRQRRDSWWNRNSKWALPVGCLSPLVLCGGCITVMIAVVFGTLKSSDVYQEAVAKAKANEVVQAALGTPIEEGFFVMGNINVKADNVKGATGKADLQIPISGPKGSATIYADAEKVGGQWTYSRLEVAFDGAGTMDLLKK